MRDIKIMRDDIARVLFALMNMFVIWLEYVMVLLSLYGFNIIATMLLTLEREIHTYFHIIDELLIYIFVTYGARSAMPSHEVHSETYT